jgi:hypothetical protein
MSLRTLARSLTVAAAILSALPALADEFTDRANNLYRSISQAQRSDLVLLPLLAKMDPPPAAVATPVKAALLPAGSSDWAGAEQWAQAAPQRAVLEALNRITKDERPDSTWAFGQPYGTDALATTNEGAALIKAKLYTDLGDPPTLAGAKFLYLTALDNVACLANVEATRLAADGKIKEAAGVMSDWLFFARQIADRQMYVECRWGLRAMNVAIERLRDIAYLDFHYGKKVLKPDEILAEVDRLREANGFLRLDRIRFPEGNRIAAQQTLATVFVPKGGPNATFGQTMARLASTQRPLRFFAEVARWDGIASKHATAADSATELKKVYDDLAGRWPLDPFDARLDTTTDYEKMDKDEYAALAAVVPEMSDLFLTRRLVWTEAVGTRCALGILAFYYARQHFPPQIESIRPRFAKTIEADPFNPDRARGKQPPLQYFVPIRDETFPSGTEPHPHEINVTAAGVAFQVKIGDDQFVLYSVGPNGEKDWANNVSAPPTEDGDMLLWPPVISLLRQHLAEAAPGK